MADKYNFCTTAFVFANVILLLFYYYIINNPRDVSFKLRKKIDKNKNYYVISSLHLSIISVPYSVWIFIFRCGL